MNHLTRELAPISDAAWAQIDEEAARTLRHYLAARRLVDFAGPLGWAHSALALGRVAHADGSPVPGVEVARRRVQPLMELRAPFTLQRAELEAIARGAADADLQPVIDAARAAALAEDHVVFHGDSAEGGAGIITASPHAPVPIDDDVARYPDHVAGATALLRAAGIGEPFAIALGTRAYRGVMAATERGGYPVLELLRQILGGPVIWAAAVDGAVVLSQRGGDFTLTVGQDLSVGFRSASDDAVGLYIEESVAFCVNTPEAAVHLAHS